MKLLVVLASLIFLPGHDSESGEFKGLITYTGKKVIILKCGISGKHQAPDLLKKRKNKDGNTTYLYLSECRGA